MEEGKAAPVAGIEAAAQVVPALDLVHGLVVDDLLQDGRRRLPVDAAQHQEAAVEPRRQQMHQVAVDGGERRIADAQQVAAHGDDLGGGAGRQVEAAEEFLARALDRLLQRGDGRRIGAREIGLGGGRDAPRRRAAWWRGSRGTRGAPRRPAPDSARGSRWRWRRPRPRRDPTAARLPARAGRPWACEPPSERGSSWRPCSATVPSSSCRKETFTGMFAYSQTCGLARAAKLRSITTNSRPSLFPGVLRPSRPGEASRAGDRCGFQRPF